MSLNIYGMIKSAKILAEQAGLSIKLEDKEQPRTDGKYIYLLRPQDNWNKDQWVRWWGLFYHEVGHNDPDMRDIFQLLKDKQISTKEFFGAGMNLLDDYRQEKHRINEYYGRRMALSESHSQLLDEAINSPKFGTDTMSKERQAMESMMAFDTYLRERWMPTIAGKADVLSRKLTPQSLQWYQQLKDRLGDFTFDQITNADSEYRLWKEIIDEVFQLDSEKQEQKSREACAKQQASKGKQDGDAEKGKGESEGEGQEDGDSQGARTKEAHVSYDDLLKHDHGEGEQAIYTPLHIDYSRTQQGGEWEIKEPIVVDYRTHECTDNQRYRSYIGALSSSGKGLAATVRRLLQIRSKATRSYGQKKGKLANRSLHRLAVKDAKGYSERVFYQKRDSNILDVAVTVLGDASASMGGEKFAHMAQSAILLNEAMQTLGIPTEILTFTDKGMSKRQRMSIVKGFTEKANREKLTDRFCDVSNSMSSNADGEAILWAYARLRQQQAKRKVLIVLSDGSPASGRGDAYTHTINVVQRIEKERLVEIYGIGIMDNNVENIYTAREVINSPEELERALINVVKTKILN